MPLQDPYTIFSFGDAALTIDFGNTISEEINNQVLNLFKAFQQQPFYGMIDAVPAYSSVSIFYDPVKLRNRVSPGETIFDYTKREVEKFIEIFSWNETIASKRVRIPVCYDEEFGTDLEQIAATKNMEKQEIIQLHCSRTYRVYMIGFLPGFSYMGTLDPKIEMPRKPKPQVVAAGSVGITGMQTGIYPLLSPGGWNIIGRTPLKMFDPDWENPTLLHAGDSVEFYPINKNEFQDLLK